MLVINLKNGATEKIEVKRYLPLQNLNHALIHNHIQISLIFDIYQKSLQIFVVSDDAIMYDYKF